MNTQEIILEITKLLEGKKEIDGSLIGSFSYKLRLTTCYKLQDLPSSFLQCQVLAHVDSGHLYEEPMHGQ